MTRQEKLNFHPGDYSEWERSTRPKPVLWATPHHKTVRIRPTPTAQSGKSQKAVQNDFTTLPKLSTRRAYEKVEQDQSTSERTDNIKVLMLLIKSRKEAIKQLEERCEQLQERNLQLARSIRDTDKHSFSSAKELLIQNDQTRKSMIALKKWESSLIKCAKAELTHTEEMSHTHLNGLQKQLDMVKAEVVKAQKELRFLKTYKDMEFPVKALQIADMKEKLDRLKEMQKEEQEGVKLVFEKEMVRLERCQQQKEQVVLSAVVEKRKSHIRPIAKLMASQNNTREEINMRRKVILVLEQKNEELIKSIQELQLSRPNIRREIFPDVFLKSDKCTPDMDVHLNIPQEDLLPV